MGAEDVRRLASSAAGRVFLQVRLHRDKGGKDGSGRAKSGVSYDFYQCRQAHDGQGPSTVFHKGLQDACCTPFGQERH